MHRIMYALGGLIGVGGTAAGSFFLLRQHDAYTRSMDLAQRGQVDFFAPLRWQLSLGSGIALLVLAIAFAALLIGLGRVLVRMDRIERRLPRAADSASRLHGSPEDAAGPAAASLAS